MGSWQEVRWLLVFWIGLQITFKNNSCILSIKVGERLSSHLLLFIFKKALPEKNQKAWEKKKKQDDLAHGVENCCVSNHRCRHSIAARTGCTSILLWFYLGLVSKSGLCKTLKDSWITIYFSGLVLTE